ncbi:MAG: hypothetical protein ACXWVV_02830 [Kaistella sp.]
MDTELLKILGQVAGIGGVGAGILLIIYKEIIRKNIFPNLGKDYAYFLLRLIVILVWSIAAIGIGGWIFIEYTKNSNVHKIEGKSDTWLRMKYTVCTGPYNHAEEMLGTTKQELFDEANDKKVKNKRYLINNQIFKALKKIDALSGGTGLLADVTIDSTDIKNIFHVTYNGSKTNRVNKYFDYFYNRKPDINLMKTNNLLPFYLR